MILYPAIDLMGGKCVRLRQGRFEDSTVYGADPVQAVRDFAAAGALWAHVVDLDGARAGAPLQHALLERLAGASPLKLQVAGGIRSSGDLERLFDAGVSRAVIGSLAVKAPELVRAFLDEFGAERVALALDVRMRDDAPFVTTSGWQETSGQTLWQVAGAYPAARHVLITDISRDGMMSGPNSELIEDASARLPHLSVQASGGVSSLEDLAGLAKAGAAGAIVGKALWEGKIDLAEALRSAGA